MNNIENIYKTKYRYLMDNLDLSTKAPILRYTIPVDKNPPEIDGFLNRDYPSTDISNIDFVNRIDKTADALIAFGIKKGDFVIICHSNTPEIFYMDYALSKIGAVPSYVYPNITADEMKHYIDEVNAKYIFMLDEISIRNMVLEAVKEYENIKIIASSVIESFPKMFKTLAIKKSGYKKSENAAITYWSDFIKSGSKTNAEEAEYVPNSLCSLTHTSGTTSTPKAVMESNENINSISLNYYIGKFDFLQGKNLLMTIPYYVEFGKTSIHTVLSRNVIILITPEYNPLSFPQLLFMYKPDYFNITPTYAKALISYKTKENLTFLETPGLGGDGFDDIEEGFNKYLKNKGCKSSAYNGYGSTEISAAGIINTPLSKKVGSLGVALGKTIAKIFEPDTENELPVGEIGELAVTGPTVALGYYNDPVETAKVFRKHSDGKIWVHMGDLARVDEDGFFYYEGRIKNVIARKSFKFSPNEIVDAIMKHENVSECVVVAKYSEEEGQTPSAHIVLKDSTNDEKTLDEIKALVDKNVQEFHRPTDYKIRKSIVKTRNNKTNIVALRIEDNATIHPLVDSAEIELVTDGTADYTLTLKTASPVAENEQKEIIDFITDILEKEKLANSKIKYIFA